METTALIDASYSPEQIEHYALEMESQGYFIIEDILSSDEVELAISILNEIFERESKIGPERGWHTDMYKVSYLLPQKHPFFRRLPLHPKVLPLMRHILGERCVMSSLNGFTMIPGSADQRLHLDQAMSVPGMVLNINAMFCLDDFTKANGATRVIPGSHKRIFDRDCDRSKIEQETIQLTAPAGSMVAFNGGLWHGGSHNTTNGYRRALHAFYSRPWVKPQWDFPRSFSPDVIESMSNEERRIYGIGRSVPIYNSENDTVIGPGKESRYS
jgi:ectoine hydroxylase-related dioxygenase (phytanoyl-CoA dioxygenase family)